jgi:hypothetical protein
MWIQQIKNSVNRGMKTGRDYRPKTIPRKSQDGISRGLTKSRYADGIVSADRQPAAALASYVSLSKLQNGLRVITAALDQIGLACLIELIEEIFWRLTSVFIGQMLVKLAWVDGRS